MSSRRSVRQLLVAVLLGVLVGGGLLAVTPAGAEVSQAVSTNWKKIWKKNLRPLADKRYYTKAQSDAKYQPKGSYETAGSGYTKAESDAKYAGAGSSYSKAESDAKYAPFPSVVRGAFEITGNAATAGNGASEDISFGVTFAAAPTVHVIAPGAVPPAGCSGSLEAPNADPGHLCIFQRANFNIAPMVVCTVANSCGTAPTGKANAFGAWLFAFSSASGYFESGGSWAARPGTLSTARVAPSPSGASSGPGGTS